MKSFRKQSRKNQVFIFLALIFILLFVFNFILQNWQEILMLVEVGFNPKRLEKVLAKRDFFDFITLVGITSLMSAVPFFSSSVIGVVNGLVFGPSLGSMINILGNTFGNVITTFVLKSTRLQESTKEMGNIIERLSRFKNRYFSLWLGYTVPFIPSFLVNYSAISFGIALRHQFFLILLGVTPTSVIYACGGYAILKGKIENLILLAILILIPYSLYAFIHKKRLNHSRNGEI